MKLKYMVLSAFLTGISLNVFANDIFCPKQLVCYNKNCIGDPMPLAVFDTTMVAPGAPPLPDGVYYFSEAQSTTANMEQCQYRDLEGHTWEFLKTSKRLMPDVKTPSNAWLDVGKTGQFLCNPNTTSPYLANPYRCPFLSQ